MKHLYFFIALVGMVCACSSVHAQQFVFATLDGNPINTVGWNLNGNPVPTPVDFDGNGPDELLLCPAQNSRNGSCFWGTPLDLGLCDSWTAEFDYRIWNGSGADGIAFCFLANPPTGPIGGGGVGIPSNPQGLMVVLDQYNNCGGGNPELQIRYGSGVGNYTECPNPPQPTLYGLGILRQPGYNRMRVSYNAGNIDVSINGTSYLTGYYLTNYVGYLGFTSSTGGSNDNHSIKNVVISTSLPNAVAYAVGDLTMCSGETRQLGAAPEPNVQYTWTPATGLSDPNIANPTITLINNTTTPVVATYTLSAVNPNGAACVNQDVVNITVVSAIADAGTDETICLNDVVTLNANGGTGYAWSPATGLSDPAIANPDASPATTTTYTVTASVTVNGVTCNGTDDITVNVNPLPVADAGTDDEICENDAALFNASGGVGYAWSPSTGLNNAAIATPSASPLTTTTYTVTVTDANNCSATDDLTLTVFPLPIVSFSGLDLEYCEDAPLVTLSGQPTGGVFDGPGINGQDFVPGAAGIGAQIVSYTFTDNNGCTNMEYQSVTIDPEPQLDIQNLDEEYCLDEPIANLVTTPPGGNLTGTGITGPNFDPSASGAGQYQITYSYTDQNGCDDTITRQVEVLNVPVSAVTPTDAICYGYADGEATVTVASGLPPYDYSWNTIPSQNTATATGLATGTYTVTVTDANGCTFEETTTINEPIELQVDIIADEDSLFLGEITALNTVNNITGGISYEWSPEEFLDCTDCPTPNARPIGEALSGHEFSVIVTDDAGCTATNTVELTIKLPKVFFIPSAFTPNGDGANDELEIFTEGTKQFNLQIFDRWGSMVYQSNDPDAKWDGSYKGKQLDPGIYIYRLTLAYLDNVYLKDAGSITIIR